MVGVAYNHIFYYICNHRLYRMRQIFKFMIAAIHLAILASCINSGYRISLQEIDSLADEYPAQAKVFLSRADSNDNKGYYHLLAAKIDYQLKGFSLKDNDIDEAINIFTQGNNKSELGRALYYKGALVLNTYRDTLQAIDLLQKASRYDTNMRTKEKIELYNLLCRITHQNSYTVKLEDEARSAHDIQHRAWALLYRAINNNDEMLADKAIELAHHAQQDKLLGNMYYYYFQALKTNMHATDAKIADTIEKAKRYGGIRYGNDIDYFHYLWQLGKSEGKEIIKNKISSAFTLFAIDGKYYYPLGYNDHLPYYYLLALHYGDTISANYIANELRQEAPLIAKQDKSEKAKEVELMYQGGNTRYRYELIKTWIFVGIIFILATFLVFAYLYISRMRKTQRTINALHQSLHQLKDVENVSLSQKCEALNHNISTQLCKLRRREKDIVEYKSQINELTDISQGLVYYSMAIQNKNISQIGKQGIRQILASYKMIDEMYAKRLDNYDLNPSQCLFCILYHIGKTDEEVMDILQYSISNIRVRKSRIKGDAEVNTFEEVVN